MRLSAVKEFLRQCPSCGRRFVVRQESKKLVDVQTETERIVHSFGASPVSSGGGGNVAPPADVTTEEEVPIEVETFEVTYKCRHCNNEWTETLTDVGKP
jgi:DNA-directed RNA polymerase subunit RPC12/RpoP